MKHLSSTSKRRGPVTLIVLCGVPVVLWAVAGSLETRFASGTSTLTSIAIAFGLAGAAAFALNLFIGARFRFVSEYFGGLDAMYATHRRNGRAAFLLLVTHAVVIAGAQVAQSWPFAYRFLGPDASWVVRYGEIALAAMAVSLFITLFVHVNHEVFVWVQRSFGFIFMLALFHIFLTPGVKALSPALTYYMAGVASLGLGGFIYRSLLGDLLVARYHYRVSEARPLGGGQVLLVTMKPEGRRLRHRPGQFVFVDFLSKELRESFRALTMTPQENTALFAFNAGAARKQFHPFSIVSSPSQGTLQLAIKASGDYTEAIRVLEPGALVRVEGPFGEFSHLNVPNPRQVWIAGGIGITPFVSMARSLGSGDHSVDLYYSTKTLSEAYFLDELMALAASYPGLRVIPYPEDDLGFLTSDDVEAGSGALAEKDFLICGPPVMIVALREQLRAKGVPPDHIHFEEFGFLGG